MRKLLVLMILVLAGCKTVGVSTTEGGFAEVAPQIANEMMLDALYDFDCAITDVHCAIAESGSIAIKPSANHGRGLSLVPMYHIALVEPSQILPDMIDLFAHLRDDPDRGNVILISGPSKTADIEQALVVGAHGPRSLTVVLA